MLPQTISTCVSQDAMKKVTRLFNNTIEDVLAELIQNARRAGASAITLETRTEDDVRWLNVTDDGSGIADPSVLLSLGRSDWNSDIMAREDPAGMGVFSLAGRRVEIRSRAASSRRGWHVAIAPDNWESSASIAVNAASHPVGTTIAFALSPPWDAALNHAAREAARFAPIEVRFDGATLPSQDFLAGAEAIVERDGVRIGIFRQPWASEREARLNFHGVTVRGRLPVIIEPGCHWAVRVDIVDAPDLHLVLPARKEVVENATMEGLRVAVRIAIYEHIAKRESHRLSYANWCDARNLGVALPEATPLLQAWQPAQADRNSDLPRQSNVLVGEPLLVGAFGPAIEQCAAFALAKDARFIGRLADMDPPMEGYGWYDALPRITAMHFAFEQHGTTSTFHADDDMPAIESGSVDKLTLFVEISAATTETFAVPAPVTIVFDEGWHCCLDDARVVFTASKSISADELVDLLEGTCFLPSTESDADSWETQHDHFLVDAREIATSLLEGEDAAMIEKVRNILEDRVRWFIPEGRTLHAAISRDGFDLRLDPALPPTEAEPTGEKP